MMRAYYERLDGDTAPAWPGVGSAEGTYDRIVAEAQRSWTHWSGLHGIEPFAVDRAIEHAVHITISTLQQDPCIAPGGDTAPDDEQRRNRRLAARIASGSAPLDDEMIATMRQTAGANLNPPGPRVVQLLAELDRVRSDAAALRAAGDELADASWPLSLETAKFASDEPVDHQALVRQSEQVDVAVQRWRSASPAAGGGGQT